MLAVAVEELRREGARAYSRGIGLHDAEHVIEDPGSQTRTGAGKPCGGVGRRDERISAKIDVEHGGLRTLEEHIGPLTPQPMQRERDIRHERQDRLAQGEQLIESLLEVDGRTAKVVLQHEIVEIEHFTQLGGEAIALEEVGHAHRPPGRLVFVCRPDAATGGPYRIGPARMLACLIQLHMRGQDERATRRDPQPVEDRYALFGQRPALPKERRQRQHDAIADEATDVLVQNAGRDER